MADTSIEGNYHNRVASVVQELIRRARSLEARLRDVLTPLEAEEIGEYAKLYHKLEQSNSHFPFGAHTDYHTKDWSVSSGFVSSAPGNAPLIDRFRELKPEEKAELEGRWQAPVVTACTELQGEAKQLFLDAAGRLVILRRLNGFDQTLAQLGETLNPPWAKPIRLPDIGSHMQPAWSWRSNEPFRRPFYQRLDAIRKANLDTLRLIYDKTRALRAILEGTEAEIPVSTLLEQPSPIPSVLINISKLVTTSIGDNANIEGSAVGPEASLES